jgi:hypothetical protein
MKDESNLYAPPQTAVSAPMAAAAAGHDWKIEDNSLWVRDGAVLPDICIWGGDQGSPGSRGRWRLPATSKFRAQVISISTFQSRYSSLKRAVRIFGGLVVAFPAGVTTSELMVGDGSATPTTIAVSVSVIGLGIALTVWQSRHIVQITETRDDWHRLSGIPPAVVKRLKEIRTLGQESVS